MLESLAYSSSAFVTLTYATEFLPVGGSLSDAHWREFSKGISCRYFGCGEYGETSGRPHYHLILFGLQPGEALSLAQRRWRYGSIHVGHSVSTAVARYLAAYTVKKMTADKTQVQSEFLKGRRPEFARMSRRPAIGWPGLPFLVRWLTTAQGRRYLDEHRDVPQGLRIDRRVYPLGRTLVGKLRELADVDPADPVRRAAQVHDLRCVQMDELANAKREELRFGRYDVLKGRHDRRLAGPL